MGKERMAQRSLSRAQTHKERNARQCDDAEEIREGEGSVGGTPLRMRDVRRKRAPGEGPGVVGGRKKKIGGDLVRPFVFHLCGFFPMACDPLLRLPTVPRRREGTPRRHTTAAQLAGIRAYAGGERFSPLHLDQSEAKKEQEPTPLVYGGWHQKMKTKFLMWPEVVFAPSPLAFFSWRLSRGGVLVVVLLRRPPS
ncbi:hypothetical protein HPB50_005992 [Hyalomma asiaticum]|uniref:Uncharacterized protein n=1 Tax=Hyalomma asiaticum TaxID=266040 RepID=A0ACB7S7B6_HYAAI|nr:hypothetical protein HPB50_005992 [Hyalomma asiaticum]